MDPRHRSLHEFHLDACLLLAAGLGHPIFGEGIVVADFFSSAVLLFNRLHLVEVQIYHFVEQDFLPPSLKDRRYYQPTEEGTEKEISKRMKEWWGDGDKQDSGV